MAAKSKRKVEPKVVRPDDIDPHYNWTRPIQAPGHTQVDFEERINFRRLHDYRLARVHAPRCPAPVSVRCSPSISTTSAIPPAP